MSHLRQMQIEGVAYTVGNNGIDASTSALQALSYEHHEIHSGSHYYLEDVADQSINNVLDVQWVTPNTTEWAHFVFILGCESETEWFIYETAVISVAGTALTPINNNRNSINTSNATLTLQNNTNLANANADTDVSGATVLAHGVCGSGRDAGVLTRDRELMLKQNTSYCMRGIATTAGYINFLMEWYEHTDKF